MDGLYGKVDIDESSIKFLLKNNPFKKYSKRWFLRRTGILRCYCTKLNFSNIADKKEINVEYEVKTNLLVQILLTFLFLPINILLKIYQAIVEIFEAFKAIIEDFSEINELKKNHKKYKRVLKNTLKDTLNEEILK